MTLTAYFEGECMNDRFFLQCMVLIDMDQLSEYFNVDECVAEVHAFAIKDR